jgi:hypothetical protein
VDFVEGNKRGTRALTSCFRYWAEASAHLPSLRANGRTVKARLLLTTALFMFAQIPASQAQATVDVSKITCEDYFMDKITFSQYIVMWLSGYYNGKRNNTIIDPGAVKNNEEKVNRYCYQHRETTVMDAAKTVLSFDK